LVKHIVDTEVYVKFQTNIQFGFIGRADGKFSPFVDSSNLGKVTIAFHESSNGYEVTAKMLNLGYYFTPGYYKG
jgi:hypothetical protein